MNGATNKDPLRMACSDCSSGEDRGCGPHEADPFINDPDTCGAYYHGTWCGKAVADPVHVGRFTARLHREIQTYPRLFMLLILVHARFVGYCVGRLT